MVKLSAKTPLEGMLPVHVAGCSLSELTPDAITSITPQTGRLKQVSDAMKKTHGLTFPGPNRATGNNQTRCIWFSGGQAMLLGPAPKSIENAALSDQSDGWAVTRLQGIDAEAVLARLVPVDLRRGVFKRGHSVRTVLFHMPVSITRTATDAFDIMVFRSMAVTAVHELKVAMSSVAALNV